MTGRNNQSDNRIDWPTAIFGAALVGGVVYGLATGLAVILGNDRRWFALPLSVTTALVVVGVGMALICKGSRARTAGAAIASSWLVGGPIMIEVFLLVMAHPND